MTTMREDLARYRTAILQDVDRYIVDRTDAQRQIVRDEVEAVAEDVVAAPLGVALADALGAKLDRQRAAGLATALLELAALSLRRLCGGGDGRREADAEPLTLNAADGLYALCHLALLDLAASLEVAPAEALARLDALVAAVWEGSMAAGPFGDGSEVAGRLGSVAGATAALVAERGDVAGALAELGEALALRWSGGAPRRETSGVVNRAPFTEDERVRLLALSG